MTTSDNRPSRSQSGETLCLHCRVVEAIYADFDAKGSSLHGETLLNMPDKKERDRRLKEMHRAIRDAIPGIRARGEGAYPRIRQVH